MSLPTYWCGYACRKDGDYMRTVRGRQCCTCKGKADAAAGARQEKEAKRLAAQREKAGEKAAAEQSKTRARKAAARKLEAARAVKEAEKAAQKEARAAFREAIRRAAIAAKAKATRDANKAMADQRAQAAAVAAAAGPERAQMVFEGAPWDDDSSTSESPAGPVVLDVSAAAPQGMAPERAGLAPWEAADEAN